MESQKTKNWLDILYFEGKKTDEEPRWLRFQFDEKSNIASFC